MRENLWLQNPFKLIGFAYIRFYFHAKNYKGRPIFYTVQIELFLHEGVNIYPRKNFWLQKPFTFIGFA